MNIYNEFILPHLVNLSMRNPAAKRERERLVPLAAGKVLEIGIGSGLNLPFYSDKVTGLTAVEPSAKLRAMVGKKIARTPFPVEFVGLSGEDIPLDDDSMDCAVSTWTLCTIPDAVQALSEIKRVLKPDGELIFIEHGRAIDANIAKWQSRLNPVWKPIAGGCNLDRRIDDMLGQGGFRIKDLEVGYVEAPKILAYTYRGVAVGA